MTSLPLNQPASSGSAEKALKFIAELKEQRARHSTEMLEQTKENFSQLNYPDQVALLKFIFNQIIDEL